MQADLCGLFYADCSVWTILCRLICMDYFMQTDLYGLFYAD